MKSQRGSRGKLYSFFNLGARWRWMVKDTPRWFFLREEAMQSQRGTTFIALLFL